MTREGTGAGASAGAGTDAGKATGSNDAVQEQFSRRADRYTTSHVHASGEDLAWVVAEASLTGGEHILDVATGAGHTAFALAGGAQTVTGVDLTARMVDNATRLAAERGLDNVQFLVADAVHMPFPDHHFDIVACRFAAHHFVDPDASIGEMSRVLKPDGLLLMVDHIAPDEARLDEYINRIDWLRDQSHVREWTAREWLHRFQQAGVSATVVREWDLHMEVSWWIDQSAPDEERRAEIDRMFREADANTRAMFAIQFDDHKQPVSFALKCVLFKGRKVAPIARGLCAWKT